MGLDVVIIDEEPKVARALARELRCLNLRVQTFDSAASALPELGTLAPLLLVVEFRPPTLDGVEFLRLAMCMVPSAKRCLSSTEAASLDPEIFVAVLPCYLLSKPWTVNDVTNLASLIEDQ